MSTIVLVRSMMIIFLFVLLSGCSHDMDRSMSHTMSGTMMTGLGCNTIDTKLDNIKHDYSMKKVTSNECHMDTHMLTRKIVALFGVDVAQEHISYQCRSAMVHGIMEGFAITNSGSVSLIEDMVGFCNKHYTSGSAHWSECIHGVGNGFIVINNLDIIKSINQCELLKDQKLLNICVSGVYGGLFRYDPVKDRDGSFCQGKPYEPICRNYIGFYFDPQKDTEKSWCALAQDTNNCGFGLGVMYSRSTDNDIEKIKSTCQTKSCLQGAIWEAERVEKSEVVKGLIVILSK